jgi:membrane-associated protease RseP (regulator of RpoE activity)
MESATRITTTKKLGYILAGLGGISLVILIHEIGHFLFAYLFSVPTPVFSIGFGPALFSSTLGKTVFKIGLLPFGGYVQMNEEILAQQSYIPKMLIVFGGILFNFIFAYGIVWFYAANGRKNILKWGPHFIPNFRYSSIGGPHMKRNGMWGKGPDSTCNGEWGYKNSHQIIRDMSQAVANLMVKKDDSSRIMGPIGIISMIGKSLAVDPQLYWFILAILSLNMGFFNIIPLPFFDGGLALRFTIEALMGRAISPHIIWITSAIFLILFVAFMMQVTMNDIKQLVRK